VITVSVYTVDGGLQEWKESDSLYTKLLSLRRNGCVGKALIHSLLTDDWGSPPAGVRIHGKLEDGTHVDEYLPYN